MTVRTKQIKVAKRTDRTYCIPVSKSLVDLEVLNLEKEYDMKIYDSQTGELLVETKNSGKRI